MSKPIVPRRRYAIHAVVFALSSAFLLSPAPASESPAAASRPHPVQSPRIREIQGAGHLSPLVNAEVAGVAGVVTAKRADGFFMEDPVPDADARTSEGIFVFTNANVSAGDRVSVTGTVNERRQGPDAATNANLSVTQIRASSVNVTSSGNPLPRATVVGAGGRVPPSSVVEDDAGGNVETGGDFDPATDGVDFYESLEGMLARVNDAVAVGPSRTLRSGAKEVPVVGDGGRRASLRTPRGGIIVRQNDFNPERVFLSGELTPLADADVGARFFGPVTGVMDYSGGNFKLVVTSAPAPAPSRLRREATAPALRNQLAVAAFNVENLDPADSADKFRRLAEIVVRSLGSPDLVSVEEIQDNNGPKDDALVDADETFRRLIAAIRSAGGPAYDFRQVNPVDDQDGGEPGGNIRIGFIFRRDRGLRFVDRPGGGPTVPTSVVTGAGGPRLSSSPGRVDPTNAAFNRSRKPLAGEFTFNGRRLFVVANHFSSKGGDQPLFGRFQPPTLTTEAQRTQQARVVRDFVNSILAADRRANVIVLGDLNDFEFSTPLRTLTGGVLRNLMETLPRGERYTYVFDGNSQALDHILVSANLFASLVRFDVVHLNSEYVEQASDHDPTVAVFLLPSR
ncbi:MAG TPA: endonuclease/exonuclease/phosphatase family protein [Pyrinomonadaceae bacterium]|nr:endonuclease/exonuclease/phosphatase family protein [Pyrinomonadaceae bacterium]